MEKRFATPCAIVVITAATVWETKGNKTQIGRPRVGSDPKYTRSPPLRSRVTGKTITATKKIASISGAHRKRSGPRCPRRNPTPIPRNEPSRTKFEKYDRYTT